MFILNELYFSELLKETNKESISFFEERNGGAVRGCRRDEWTPGSAGIRLFLAGIY